MEEDGIFILSHDALEHIFEYLQLWDICQLMRTCHEMWGRILYTSQNRFRRYYLSNLPKFPFRFLGADYYSELVHLLSDTIAKNADGFVFTTRGLLFTQEQQAFRIIYRIVPVLNIIDAHAVGDWIYFIVRPIASIGQFEIYRCRLHKTVGTTFISCEDTHGTVYIPVDRTYRQHRCFSIKQMLLQQYLYEDIYETYYASFTTPVYERYHFESTATGGVIFIGFRNGQLDVYKDGVLQRTLHLDIMTEQFRRSRDPIYKWELDDFERTHYAPYGCVTTQMGVYKNIRASDIAFHRDGIQIWYGDGPILIRYDTDPDNIKPDILTSEMRLLATTIDGDINYWDPMPTNAVATAEEVPELQSEYEDGWDYMHQAEGRTGEISRNLRAADFVWDYEDTEWAHMHYGQQMAAYFNRYKYRRRVMKKRYASEKTISSSEWPL